MLPTNLFKLRVLISIPLLFAVACESGKNDQAELGDKLFGAVGKDMPIQEIVAQTFVLQDFEALLVTSGVSQELESPPYTFFAPWDVAFEKLPYWTKITKNKAWYGHLRDLTLNHIHAGNLPKDALEDGMTTTMLNGDVANITRQGTRPRVDDISIIADVAGADGHVYILDEVREPKWAKRTILDIIDSDERFTILSQILSLPGMNAKRKKLQSAKAELTFFAPTDEALAGFNFENCTDQDCLATLDLIVKNHLVKAVIPKRFAPTQSFTAQSGATLAWSFEKESIACTQEGDEIFLDGIDEQFALNGIVHPVNRLLCFEENVLNSPGDFSRTPLVTKLAVIMVGEHTPDQIRQIEKQLDPNQQGATDYYAVNSNGIERIQGATFGPYPYHGCFMPTTEKGCHFLIDSALRLAAAEWAGRPINSCPIQLDDSIVQDFKKEFLMTGYSFVYDLNLCSASPFSYMGHPGNTSENLLFTTIFSLYTTGDRFDKLFEHEFGHNLGLGHVNVLWGCDMFSGNDVIDGNIPENHCGSQYIAGHTVMGNGYSQSVTAPHKRYMGWLRNCEDIEAAGGSATYRLNPIGGQCGLRSLRIPVPGLENHNYYVEYRSPKAGPYSGYKNRRDDPLIQAVLIYIEDEIDKREGVRVMGGPLGMGVSYNLPGGVGVRLIRFDDENDTAIVEVTNPSPISPPTCHDGTALLKTSGNLYAVQCGSTP